MGFEPFQVIAKTLDFDGGFVIQPRDSRLLCSESLYGTGIFHGSRSPRNCSGQSMGAFFRSSSSVLSHK
jgi:hypothetical protein